ncbi:MAG: lipocalin family protein, partial [Desulfobacterales bacterium]|nr:lipocalin family protein [Desulfobacterales bacterium]
LVVVIIDKPDIAEFLLFCNQRDELLQYLVCGPNKSYLWILARKPHMEESLKSELIKKAKALGFATDKMIYVSH